MRTASSTAGSVDEGAAGEVDNRAGRRQGREVRFVVRREQLDAVRRRMAQIASEWDARLAAIKRLAES